MSASKVTYVSLSADDPAIDAGFDAAIAAARATLGESAPLRLAGTARAGAGEIESRNPADRRVVVARVADHVDLAGMGRAAVHGFNVSSYRLLLCAPVTRSRLSLRLPAVAGSASSESPDPMRAR